MPDPTPEQLRKAELALINHVPREPGQGNVELLADAYQRIAEVEAELSDVRKALDESDDGFALCWYAGADDTQPIQAEPGDAYYRAVARLSAVRAAVDASDAARQAYEADPVNAYDRPYSWMKLDDLILSVKKTKEALDA